MRGGRDALLSIGLGWGLLIVALPEGLSRAGSSLQVQEDKSIRHRLHVWEGALQMMAEHPGKGVGADQFGKVFPQLYQIPLHKDEYSTAISDYFTWAAERGVWVVGAWTGLLVFLLVAGGLLARNVQQSWMAPFVGALLTLGLASAFSSLGFVREIQAYWGFLAGALLLIYLWRLAYGHLQGTRMVWMARAGFFVLAACAGWWILGQWALSRLPTLTYPITANESVAQTASGWVSLPCHTAPQGIVWYFPDNNEDEATLLRTTIRPLAARGWVVICTSPNDSAVDVATLLRMEQQALGNKVLPRHLAGHSRGGTAALLTALRGKEQIKVDSVSVFGLRPTSEDREARTALGKDAPPLRIMHSKWDDQAPFNPVSRLVRDLQTSGSALKVVWVDEEVSRNSPMWQEWVNFVGGND